MTQIVKATEAVRSFYDIINRVYYKGENFDIEKGNNTVTKITPVENKFYVKVKNLDEFFKNGPHLDPENAEQFMKDVDDVRRSTRINIEALYRMG